MSTPVPGDPSETPCPARDDAMHCNCWYDGEACCACNDPAMTREQMLAQGMDPDEPTGGKG